MVVDFTFVLICLLWLGCWFELVAGLVVWYCLVAGCACVRYFGYGLVLGLIVNVLWYVCCLGLVWLIVDVCGLVEVSCRFFYCWFGGCFWLLCYLELCCGGSFLFDGVICLWTYCV